MNPVGISQELSIEAYTSADWFAAEQAGLFGRVWNFVCLVRDLTKPGDFACASAGSYPVVVLRDRDGELRAFHNRCRHRGSRLLEDIYACEAVQAGMASPAYEIGAMSGYEDALSFFQRQVLDYVAVQTAV